MHKEELAFICAIAQVHWSRLAMESEQNDSKTFGSESITEEKNFIRHFYHLLGEQNFAEASDLFHKTSVVLINEQYEIFTTAAQREKWLTKYAAEIGKQWLDDYDFELFSTRALSEQLRFTQLRLCGTAKNLDEQENIDLAFTISSDHLGKPKIIVMVLDE